MRLEDIYGAEVGLRHLFDHPTPADVAVEVERQIEEGAEPPLAIPGLGSSPPGAS